VYAETSFGCWALGGCRWVSGSLTLERNEILLPGTSFLFVSIVAVTYESGPTRYFRKVIEYTVSSDGRSYRATSFRTHVLVDWRRRV
jgi:hypothetical protein